MTPAKACVITVLLMGLWTPSVPAQTLRENGASLLLAEVPLAHESDAARLSAAGFDVAGVNRRALTAQIAARPQDLSRIAGLGFAYTVKDMGRPLRESAEAFGGYSNPAELEAFLDQIVAAHPDLVQKVVLKDALFEGQKLMAAKITADVSHEHARPAFLLDAQHHAREVMTPEIAKDAIGVLASGYGTDPRVTAWLDAIEIWIVASVNPDGAMYVFDHDRNWRKNRHPGCAVDLNRNYGWNWNACQGSSGECLSETYRGAGPASEPETQGMTDLVDRIRPLFNLSYHSYGEYLLYPYGCEDPGEMAVYDNLARGLGGLLEDDTGATGQYTSGPGWSSIYTTDGTSDDTLYGRYGTFAFVIEVNCCSFQPDFAQWRDVTVARQRVAWQYFLDQTLASSSLQGRVTDTSTGLPLAATVSLQEVALTRGETPRRASAAGQFGWPVLGSRTYHATFSLPGYADQTHEVVVGTGPALLDIALVPTLPAAVPHDPSPALGALSQSTGTLFEWSSEGAASFEVHLGRSASPPPVATVTEPRFATQGLDLGETYYWQIVALGSWGRAAGPLWSFSTRPCALTSAKKAGNPFRLVVDGQGFAPGQTLLVDGVPAPFTLVKSAARLVAKGAGLKALAPKGKTVSLVVRDSSGGESEPFAFGW